MGKTKLGPAYKYGEPSVLISIRVPKSVYDRMPEPKRETATQWIMAEDQKGAEERERQRINDVMKNCDHNYISEPYSGGGVGFEVCTKCGDRVDNW
jgi:hypothetical protein